MSEKTLWQWVCKKMEGHRGFEGHRIENCSSNGIPDAIVRIDGVSIFIELKDWSTPKKHPLLIEQKNFIDIFGGIVLVKTSATEMAVCRGNLAPLLSCDVGWAGREGRIFNRSNFKPDEFADELVAIF